MTITEETVKIYLSIKKKIILNKRKLSYAMS